MIKNIFKINILLAFIFIISCKKQASKNIEVKGIKPKQTTQSYYKSNLRKNENLQLATIYTDTVSFIKFDDNYDDWLTLVKKRKDTIALISNEQQLDFAKGDVIEIKWKIDSLRPAGDPDFIEFKEFLVASKKIKSIQLTDKKVKFLWTQSVFDKKYNAEVYSLMLDYDYIKTISEPEKAALAYISFFYGNECEWDGKPNENRTNLKCKIPWALGLRYQCSFEQKELLKYWFRNDKTILQEIESCPTIPDGATVQTTFNEIDIVTSSNVITVFFKATNTNLRTSESRKWTEKFVFEFNTNELVLKNKQVSEKENVKIKTIVKTNEVVFFRDEFKKLALKNLPLIDSTSFDSDIIKDNIQNINIEVFKLPSIYKNWYKKTYNFKLISCYGLFFSKNFYSVVLTVKKGENEIETSLVNYDLEGNIIDLLIVAYDEIAESFFKKQSKIDKDKITVKSIEWIDTKKETIAIMVINPNGKFSIK